MKPRISVIVPTIGRDTLQRALDSCAGADEVIVIHNQDGDHGYRARTQGMADAKGTHLAFLDDDDVYAAGAIDLMREAACRVPVIFRMRDAQSGNVVWDKPELRFANVGTPMICVPRRPSKLGVWEPHNPFLRRPGGDFVFIQGCCERMGEPVWREEVVAVIRPRERQRRRVAA